MPPNFLYRAHTTTTDTVTTSKSTTANHSGASSNVVDLTHDDDMRRAMELSLQDRYLDVSNEDRDISRALEASLTESQTLKSFPWLPDPLNPHERIRELNRPVGLKNVGNTCWFSAVIQSLFNLPVFRNLVLQFNPVEYNNRNDIICTKYYLFMQELRNLFGLLIGSTRKYIDPTNAVRILQGAFSDSSVSAQQDVSEFTGKLLEWVEDALKMFADITQKEEQDRRISSTALQDIFCGQIERRGINDGKEFLAIDAFIQYPIQISGKKAFHGELESSLINFSDEANHSEQWFTKLPPVLILELSRFKFNQSLNKAEKIHDSLSFPDIIYLDRYLEANRNITTTKRQTSKELSQKLIDIQTQLSHFEKYGRKKKFPLNDALDCVIDFCHSQNQIQDSMDVDVSSPMETSTDATDAVSESASVSHIHDILSTLKFWKEKVDQQMRELQLQIDSLQSQIDEIYEEDSLKKVKYKLHAVLVHEGQASTGHYWCYVFNPRNHRWRRYNDITVTDSVWNDLNKECIGGDGSTVSAYCLIYVDAARVDLIDKNNSMDITTLPADLREFVEEDNKKFSDEIAAWDEKQQKNLTSKLQQTETAEHGITYEKMDEERESEMRSPIQPPPPHIPPTFEQNYRIGFDITSKSINMIFDQQKEHKPPLFFKQICDEEYQRYTVTAVDKNYIEPRLVGFGVYAVAVKAPRLFINRITIESVVRCNNDSPEFDVIRSRFKSHLGNWRWNSPEDAHYFEKLHNNFCKFRLCISHFLTGFNHFKAKRLADSLWHLVQSYEINNELLYINKYLAFDINLITLLRRHVLMELNNSALEQFKSDNTARALAAVEILRNTIVPCTVAIDTQQPKDEGDVEVVEWVRSEWCNFLCIDLKQELSEQLNDVLSTLLDVHSVNSKMLVSSTSSLLPVFSPEEMLAKIEDASRFLSQHASQTMIM